MRRILSTAAAALAMAMLPACSPGKPTPTSATPTYELPPRHVRDGETPVRTGTVQSGDLAFTVIGLTSGITELVGSHAEVQPKGTYVRVRLVTENRGRTTGTFVSTKQLLLTADGAAYKTDRDAMLIKRQPDSIDVGAAVRIELDLWYALPRGAGKPAELRLIGSPSIGAVSDPPSVDVKLP